MEGSGYGRNEIWRVRAGQNGRLFEVTRDVLCISPVLKGYIEDPDTRPDFMEADGIIAWSHLDEDIVKTVIKYLEHPRGHNLFDGRSKKPQASFFINIYKLASTLGLDDLRSDAFRYIRYEPLSIQDFAQVAVSASGVLGGAQFRGWFNSYVHQHHEELLRAFGTEYEKDRNDAWKLCAVLASALKENHEQQNSSQISALPATPPSSSPLAIIRTPSDTTVA